LVASFGVIHRPSYYTSQPATYYQVDADAGGIWLRGNERLGVVEGSAVDPVAGHVVRYIAALGSRTASRCFPALMGTTPLKIPEENGSTSNRDVSVCLLRYLNARVPLTTITSIFR